MSKHFTNVIESTVDTFATQKGLTSQSYTSGYIADAKEALTGAVNEVVAGVADTLRSYGTEQGLSETEIENVLISVGLVDAPEPEVEAEPETLEQKVERLLVQSGEQGAVIAALLAAAKANNIDVSRYSA